MRGISLLFAELLTCNCWRYTMFPHQTDLKIVNYGK